MRAKSTLPNRKDIPSYALYGESDEFPDILHCEKIADRAGNHNWIIEPHRHTDLHQFFWIADGEATANIDHTAFVITSATLLSVPRMVVHDFEFTHGTKGFVLSLPSREISHIVGLADTFQVIEKNTAIFPLDDATDNLMTQIHDEHWTGDIFKVPLLRALCVQLFCQLGRNFLQNKGGVGSLTSRRTIQKFDHLVRQHSIDRWAVSDYATALGCSRTHLNELCRATIGNSPRSYINQCIMQEACRMLAYTELDIAQIGYRLGFNDPSYFSRAFKKLVGRPPLSFRNDQQEKQLNFKT